MIDKFKSIEILKKHSNYENENGYIYHLKKDKGFNFDYFCDIMDSVIELSKDKTILNYYKDIYAIIFWSRTWLDSGLIKDDREKITIQTGIIENALYYLLNDNAEEAFFAYYEFLDGRYYV